MTDSTSSAVREDHDRKLEPLPSRVTDVEEAAAKAYVDPQTLERARADLGIVTSRSNAGGVQAVQWRLPGLAPEIGERRQARVYS